MASSAENWSPPDSELEGQRAPNGGWAPPDSELESTQPIARQTLGGAGQAAGSGLASGAISTAGLMATAPIVANPVLGAAIAPVALGHPEVFSAASDWVKDRIRDLGGSNLIDTTEKTNLNKYLHAGSEQVPGALVGGGAAGGAKLIKAASAGFGAGEAQQVVSDIPGIPKEISEPLSQAAGLVTGFVSGGGLPKKKTPARPTPTVNEPLTGNYQFPTTETDLAPPSQEGVPPSPQGGNAASPPKTPTPPVTFTSPREEGMKGVITSAESADRERAYRDLGLKEVRTSAVTGDISRTALENRWSQERNPDNTPSQASARMAAVIKSEQQALSNYAGENITMTGGTEGLDQFNLKTRGSSQVGPLDGYRNSLEALSKQHYETAKARKGDTPITLPTAAQFLADNEPDFMGTIDGKQLLEGLKIKMNQLKLTQPGPITPTGAALAALRGDTPATVTQAEGLRQFANNQWRDTTAHLIQNFKDALDSDVTKAAGEDVFGESRAIRTLRSKMLEEPEAVRDLLTPPKVNNRLQLNRLVPLEDVPRHITHLDSDQFNHLMDVYDTAYRTPELSVKAQHAVNEIRAQFANEAKAAGETSQGVWNPKGYYKYLQDNNANMSRVFSQREMQRFKTLNIAGNGLRMDTSYKGAAVEQHNLVRRGTIGLVKHAGTLIGGLAGEAATGGLAGTAIGAGAGKLAEKGAAAIESSGNKKLVEKSIHQLY